MGQLLILPKTNIMFPFHDHVPLSGITSISLKCGSVSWLKKRRFNVEITYLMLCAKKKLGSISCTAIVCEDNSHGKVMRCSWSQYYFKYDPFITWWWKNSICLVDVTYFVHFFCICLGGNVKGMLNVKYLWILKLQENN